MKKHREVPNISPVPPRNKADITQIEKIRQCRFYKDFAESFSAHLAEGSALALSRSTCSCHLFPFLSTCESDERFSRITRERNSYEGSLDAVVSYVLLGMCQPEICRQQRSLR